MVARSQTRTAFIFSLEINGGANENKNNVYVEANKMAVAAMDCCLLSLGSLALYTVAVRR